MLKKWTIRDMIRQKKILLSLIEKETDVRKKDYLTFIYDDTERLIRQLNGDVPEYRSLRVNKLYNAFFDTLTCKRYYSIISDFLVDLEDIVPKIDTLADEVQQGLNSKKKLHYFGSTATTPTQAYEHVLKFYGTIDKDISDWFQEVEKNSYVTFVTRTCSILDDGCSGTNYFIDGVNANFIVIRNNKNEKMYGDLVHEYGHAIKNIVDPKASYYDGGDFFGEVPSIFMELVSVEENEPGFSQTMMNFLKFNTFLFYFNYACCLDNHRYISHHYEVNDFMTTSTFYNHLKKEEDINMPLYRDSLEHTISEEGMYILSYITALELLHVYKEDKKEALKMFKKILMLSPSHQYLGDIQSIVPLNVYAREESEKVIDNLTLSLKKKI